MAEQRVVYYTAQSNLLTLASFVGARTSTPPSTGTTGWACATKRAPAGTEPAEGETDAAGIDLRR